ncbi:Anaphase-promoting complex subunit 2 [Hibiscus syriacus]|uniref:Anaphase-promoting complex subunit 2 n=1 Tax=Hibiscus syriacus TaxID=106335 RepID=A0A6A3B0L6_HIBSY|nr:Anaphase-promoting complex subunit 2 [Hibiscus syriacus]
MEASTYSPVGNIGTLMSLNDDTLQEILQSYDDFCAAAKSLLNGSRDLSFEHDFFSHVQTLCKHGLRSLARDYFLRSLEETFEKNGASRFWRHFENYSKIEEDLYKIDEDEIQTVLCNALEEICLEKENQEKCLLMLVHALQSYVDNLSNEKPNFDVGKDYLFSKYQLVVSSMLMANLPPHFPKVLHFYFKGRLEELNIVIDGEWNEENERPDRDKMHLDERNIGKVVCDLRNLGFTSMTEDAYASAIFMLLKAKVHDLAGDDYRSSVLDSIKGWIQVVPLQFLNALLAYLGDSISFVQHSPGTESPLASQPSSGYFGTSTPSSGLIRWKLRLEYFAYETLQDLRIAKLFEIIVDYPDRGTVTPRYVAQNPFARKGSPAIEDLKQCLKYTGQHSKLVLRTIDPAGVFLEAVGEPIRDYLRGRKDTIKCIVTMLTDGTSGNPNGSGDSGVSLLEELNRDVEGRKRTTSGVKNVWEMHISTNDSEWVKRSLTGIMKSSYEYESLKEAWELEGLRVQVLRWGYAWKACIITFASVEEFSYVWENKMEELSSCFDWLAPVLNENGIPLSLCQLELCGLPLLCWNEAFLEKLTGKWGRFICFKDESKHRYDLSFAKVLLRVKSPFDVPDLVTVGSYGDDCVPAMAVDREEPVEFSRQKVISWLNKGHNSDMNGVSGGQAASRKSNAENSNCGLSGSVESRSIQVGGHVGLGLRENILEEAKSDDNKTSNNNFKGERELAQGDQSVDLVVEQSGGQRSMQEDIILGPNRQNIFRRDNVSSDQEVVSKKRKEVLEDYQGSLKEGSVSNLSVRERMSVLRDGTSSGTMVVDRNLIKESSLDSSKYSIQEFSRAKNSMNRRRLRMAPCHSGSVCSEGEVEVSFYDRVYRRVINSMVRESLEHVREDSQPSQEYVKARAEAIATREVCEMLGISFKGGHQMIEEEIFRSGLMRKLGGNLLRGSCVVPADSYADGLMCLWNENLFEVLQLLAGGRWVCWGGGKISFKSEEGYGGRGLFSLLRGTKQVIRNWPRSNYRGLSDDISELEARINGLELKIQGGGISSQERELLVFSRKELWNLHRKEERIWLQRNRINTISSLEVAEDVISDPEQLRGFVFEYFKDNYNSKSTLQVDGMDLNFAKLTDEQKNILEVKISEQEVWETVFQSDSAKAPWPDGFTMGFFKKFWSTLKSYIMKFVEDFYNGRNWEHGVNHAFLTLIPNIRNPEGIEDYRPISLVDSLYKIISKILSRRLVSAIKDLVSSSQFAFIPERQLLDCAFLANEVIDYWRKKEKRGGLQSGFSKPMIQWNGRSCLHLNLSKSKLFGVNLDDDVLKEWAQSAGCGVGAFPMTYLRLPIGTTRNSELLWEPVLQKFNNKLAGWKATSLSMVGRLVLVKSVLSSLLIFYLSIFKIPLKINQKLNSLMANFLWGDSPMKKRIHWVNWKMVCQPYEEGGLGVLDLSLAYRALLGKWVRKFANEKDSQWKKMICCKHNIIEDFLSWSGNEDGLFSVKACRSVLTRRFILIWDVSTVLPKDPMSLLWSWSVLMDSSSIWKFIPGVVLWSLWKARNLVVFENWNFESSTLFFICRFRLAKWFLAKFPKANIQGGIGGVLKDSNGSILISFSKAVGPGPPLLAELKAIKEGMDLFLNSGWELKSRLILESDCKTSVDWILRPFEAPSFCCSLVGELGDLISAKDIVVRLVPRACNWEADNWEPDPVAADPSKGSRNRRKVDILGMIVGIIGDMDCRTPQGVIDEALIIPDSVDQLLSDYARRFHEIKTPRKLLWKKILERSSCPCACANNNAISGPNELDLKNLAAATGILLMC